MVRFFLLLLSLTSNIHSLVSVPVVAAEGAHIIPPSDAPVAEESNSRSGGSTLLMPKFWLEIRRGKECLFPGLSWHPKIPNYPSSCSVSSSHFASLNSMTINKAQGQTFQKLGVYLDKPVFSHGQLYVALLRARGFEAIHVKISQNNLQGVFNN